MAWVVRRRSQGIDYSFSAGCLWEHFLIRTVFCYECKMRGKMGGHSGYGGVTWSYQTGYYSSGQWTVPNSKVKVPKKWEELLSKRGLSFSPIC